MEQELNKLKGKKLAIIGGSYLQLPLVLKAKEMGIITYCFAWLDGAICKDYCDFFFPISILEKEKILNECKKAGIDGITTIATDAAVPTVNYVASKLGLVGNPYNKTEQYVNKYCMRIALAEANINVPKFIRLIPGNNSNFSERVLNKGLSLPLIIKPVDRSGSRGVFKVADLNQLDPMVLRASEESFTKNVIVEEFIEGREFSVESISWQGVHYILAITEKETTGEPYFVELAHHQPAKLTDDEINRVNEFTLQSLSALEIVNGASHTEIKITKEGVIYLIETGARMGGDFIGSDLVQLSTGYDFLRGVIEVSLGYFSNPVKSINKFSGIYFLSKDTAYLQKIIEDADHYSEIKRAEIQNGELKFINNSSDRSGYFIYQANKKLTQDELVKRNF